MREGDDKGQTLRFCSDGLSDRPGQGQQTAVAQTGLADASTGTGQGILSGAMKCSRIDCGDGRTTPGCTKKH